MNFRNKQAADKYYIISSNDICRWNHSKDYYIFQQSEKKRVENGMVKIDLSDETYTYLTGHVINEKNLFPATGYLFFLWEMIASLRDQESVDVPIVFEDINFIRATVLSLHNEVEFTFSVHEGNAIT